MQTSWEWFCAIATLVGFVSSIFTIRSESQLMRTEAGSMNPRRFRTFAKVVVAALMLASITGGVIGLWLVYHRSTVVVQNPQLKGLQPNPASGIQTPTPNSATQSAQKKEDHPQSKSKPKEQTNPNPPRMTQSGIGNQQTSVSVPGSLTQTTSAPCSGNSITGSIDNTNCIAGYIPSPPRKVQTGREEAVDLLKTAPAGSTVHFVIVGGSQEISDFEGQLERLFTSGGWTIAGRDLIGSLSMVTIGSNGYPSRSTGNGLNCMEGGSQEISAIAFNAMKAVRFPCSSGPVASHGGRADFYVQVSSRIPPQIEGVTRE